METGDFNRDRPERQRGTGPPETSALGNRNFLIFLCGHTVSLLGLWMYRVALGWYAWELSHSELWIGIVAATQFAPAVIFGPIFGVLADRFDRRAASMLINSISVLNMLVLGLLTSLGYMDIRVLALLSLMQGILDGAHAPVRMSVVPNLVNRAQLQSAIAIGSVSFNLSRFIGPAIAGFVIAVSGVAATFVINGLSYLAFIAALAVVTLNPSVRSAEPRKHPWQELKDGARYVLRHGTIRGLLVIAALVAVFCRGALEMLPAFADEVYRGGAAALAIAHLRDRRRRHAHGADLCARHELAPAPRPARHAPRRERPRYPARCDRQLRRGGGHRRAARRHACRLRYRLADPDPDDGRR